MPSDLARFLWRSAGACLILSAAVGTAFPQSKVAPMPGIRRTPGVFDNSRFEQPNQFLLGGATPTDVWGPANKLADGITAIVKIPASSSLYQSNAVNGYADNFSTATAGVAGYFTARCSAGHTVCWGINPQATDRNDHGPLEGVVLYGQESDIVVENSDTQVNGLAILGHFDAQPKGAWAMRVVAAPGLGRWKVGYATDDGAIIKNGSGIGLGAAETGKNSYSQILSLSGIDAGGAHRIASLQATPAGGLNLSATKGTLFAFYNGPVALSELAVSTSTPVCLKGSTPDGLSLLASCSALRKYKDNITPLPAGLDEVMQLTPVSYTSKTNGNTEIGFVAEDVEKVDKRLASYDHDGLVGVQYDHVVALLTKALQEQQAQIRNLQQQIRELKKYKSP